MTHGAAIRSSRTAGWSSDQRCSSMRLAKAVASILAMRIRPKVVSSASLRQESRNTSSGSR